MQSQIPAFHAGKIVQSILVSPETKASWDRYNPAFQGQNPAEKIRQKIQNIGPDLRDNPKLLGFMIALIAIERGALGDYKTDNPEGINNFRHQLDTLGLFLQQETNKIEPPKRQWYQEVYRTIRLAVLGKERDLTPEQKQLLTALRHGSGQTKIRPIRGPANLIADLANHIYEEAKEHKKSTAALSTLAIGGFAFMNARLGRSTIYIDPAMANGASVNDMTDTTVSLDDIMAGIEASNSTPDLVQSVATLTAEEIKNLTLHNHWVDLLGKDVGGWVSDVPLLRVLGTDYARPATLASETQGLLQGSYDFYNSRLAVLIKDPSQDLAARILPDSPFKEAFHRGAEKTAEFIYAANTFENFVLHSVIFSASAYAAYKFGDMDSQEKEENLQTAKKFLKRTWDNSKLSCTFAATAMTNTCMTNGPGPAMIWMGLGGFLTGEFMHRAIRRHKQKNRAQSTLTAAQGDLEQFSDPSVILSENRTWEKPRRLFGRLIKNKKTWLGAAFIAAAVQGDMMFNEGVWTGLTGGSAAVIASFLAVNVPEDIVAHIIFAIGGGTTGLTLSGIKNLPRKSINVCRKVAQAFSNKIKNHFPSHKEPKAPEPSPEL